MTQVRLLMFCLVACLLLASGGCATLRVQVDIFDPKGLKPEDAMEGAVQRSVLNHMRIRNKGGYETTKSDLVQQLTLLLEQLKTNGVVDPANVQTLTQNATGTVSAAMDEIMTLRNEATDLNDGARLLAAPAARAAQFRLAMEKLSNANQKLVSFRREFIHPFATLIESQLTKLDVFDREIVLMAQQSFTRNVSDKVGGLTGGQDLLGDVLAPFIVSAPKQYWKGVYNKASASGTMGNTDIAIKMETLGTFTIKGLRLDASKTTEATFQMLKQSIHMVAAAYGMPVPGSIQPAGDAAPPSDAGLISSIDQTRQQAEQRTAMSRQAALTLFDVIIAEQVNFADDAKRPASLRHIQATFEAYKGQLGGQ